MFTFHHTAISVTDLERSIDFYEKLGFKAVFNWEADDGSLRIAHLDLSGVKCQLTFHENDN